MFSAAEPEDPRVDARIGTGGPGVDEQDVYDDVWPSLGRVPRGAFAARPPGAPVGGRPPVLAAADWSIRSLTELAAIVGE